MPMSCATASTKPGGACCGSSSRISIIDYIERGLVRSRWPPLAIAGGVVEDPDARAVQFSIQLEDDVIESVAFKVSFCVTLIAYCELLAEWAAGTTLERAARIRAEDIAAVLTCVPPSKRDLVRLAQAAFSSAIRKAMEGESK